MKSPITLAPLVLVSVTAISFGQNFNSGTFFQPPLNVQHERTLGLLQIDNSANVDDATSGNVTWTNSAGGYAGVGVGELVGVHLYAYTETTGNSLVFGRDLEILGVAALLQNELNSVVGASVLSSWGATADVTGLNILAGQLYQVTFDISTGAGLPATILSNASFDVTSSGVTSFGGGSGGLLNLLNVVSIGTSPDSDQGILTFISDTNRSDLQFQFSANSALSLGLLGNIDGNRNIMTFSNIQVQAIPEPSALALSALAAGGVILRRRRGK